MAEFNKFRDREIMYEYYGVRTSSITSASKCKCNCFCHCLQFCLDNSSDYLNNFQCVDRLICRLVSIYDEQLQRKLL